MPILIPTNIYNKLHSTIYAYFFLILFDGIFRKWLLPSLSAPIMMLKQVAAIIICLIGFKYIKRMTRWEISFFFVGIIVFATTMIFGHGNLIVALYGCLPYWFGLPVCFFIGKILTEKDLNFFSKVIIYTSIANSILLIIQFMLPPSHFLNYLGSEVREEIAYVSVSELASAFRPAGIFIHHTHNSLFSLLAFSIICYFLFFKVNRLNKKVLITTCILDILACFCSASRTTLILHIAVIIYFLFIINKQYIRRLFKYSIIGISLLLLIFITPIGQKAINNLGQRFESVAIIEQGNSNVITGIVLEIISRNIEYNIQALFFPQTLDGESIPFWGFGQGMSTQTGGRIMGIDKNAGFALAEWDGLRTICESGLFLGWIILSIRLGYVLRCIPILKKSINTSNYYPIFLYPTIFICFGLYFSWGNLFIANFTFFITGYFFTTLNKNI